MFTDLQLGLQRTHPFITPEVIRNPLIEQVAEAVLGPRAFLGFVNGNTNCPGSGTQAVHMDGDWIYQSEAEAIAAGTLRDSLKCVQRDPAPPALLYMCFFHIRDLGMVT